MHSAIEMTPSKSNPRMAQQGQSEEADAPRSEYSYQTHDSQAPLGHHFPPGAARAHTSPDVTSFRPGFSDPPLSRSTGQRPRQGSPYTNEKTSFSYSRPGSPSHRRDRSTYGQIPGAAQSDTNLVFAEGDMGKVSSHLKDFLVFSSQTF